MFYHFFTHFLLILLIWQQLALRRSIASLKSLFQENQNQKSLEAGLNRRLSELQSMKFSSMGKNEKE
jgi:hypothetical protein